MNSPKLFAALLLATAIVVFGAQNTQAVAFHFLMFTVPAVALVLPLFAAILLGAILGWIVVAPGQFRRMRVRRGLETQVAAQERKEAKRIDTSQSHPSDPGTEAV